MIGQAPEAIEAAVIRQYGLRRSPVVDVLLGRTSVRQLRVMVDQLAPDPAVTLALSGTSWGADTWMLHDLTTHLRALIELTHNLHRRSGAAPLKLDPLPYPEPALDEGVTHEQAQAEAELVALMHRRDGEPR